MQSRLLLSAVLAAGAMTAGAAEFYTTDNLGEVYGISDNGRYAAITDIEGQISYIWDSENPSEFTLLDGLFRKSEAYDVSNDGMVVGGGRVSQNIGKCGTERRGVLSERL